MRLKANFSKKIVNKIYDIKAVLFIKQHHGACPYGIMIDSQRGDKKQLSPPQGIADTFTDSLAKLNNDEQKAVKTTTFDL